MRPDYDRMVGELSDYVITVQLPAFGWSTDAVTGNSYGALPLVIGPVSYLNKTGLVYIHDAGPAAGLQHKDHGDHQQPQQGQVHGET